MLFVMKMAEGKGLELVPYWYDLGCIKSDYIIYSLSRRGLCLPSTLFLFVSLV
jgi:hypothetical protein